MFYNKIKCPAHYNVCKYPVGYHYVLQKFQHNEISSDPSLVHIFVGHEDQIRHSVIYFLYNFMIFYFNMK